MIKQWHQVTKDYINNVLCYFGKCQPVVKQKLLFTYCYSLHTVVFCGIWTTDVWILFVLLGTKAYVGPGTCLLIRIALCCLCWVTQRWPRQYSQAFEGMMMIMILPHPSQVLLSASLYFSKGGAYWDRLCRDVVSRWSLVVTRVHCGQTVHPRPIVTMEH